MLLVSVTLRHSLNNIIMKNHSILKMFMEKNKQ